jgi:hypothetical protein
VNSTPQRNTKIKNGTQFTFPSLSRVHYILYDSLI